MDLKRQRLDGCHESHLPASHAIRRSQTNALKGPEAAALIILVWSSRVHHAISFPHQPCLTEPATSQLSSSTLQPPPDSVASETSLCYRRSDRPRQPRCPRSHEKCPSFQ